MAKPCAWKADLRDDIGGPVAADPAVGLHAVAHAAAEQLVDRYTERLALDVPQCLVDPGDGTHQDRAATIETAPVERLPQIVDPRRVLSDQVVRQLMDGRFDRLRASFDDGLSPTDDSLVGVTLRKNQRGAAWYVLSRTIFMR